MSAVPVSVTLFSYQVGFGDCFLLRFSYPGGEHRHVLIDFGTTGLPKTVETNYMTRVARDIADKCGGRLQAIVATHRHADHISGFATSADGSGPGNIIAALDIDLVLQPWTEAPNASIDGLQLAGSEAMAMKTMRKSLAAMQGVSAQIVRMLEAGSLRHLSGAVRHQLDFIGRDNLKNASAVENLMAIGKRAKAVYAWHGSSAGLAELLPGVVVHVLGPPTLVQTDTIRKQRPKDPAEFWHLAGMSLKDDAAVQQGDAMLFARHPTDRRTKLRREARWIAGRVDAARGEQMLSLVRALDNQMNNTSLILLFEANGRKLLFPGDAQIENWAYALQSEYAALLADVDLYKVGHHGSLNATPLSLWRAFAKKGDKNARDRLKTVLSTMPGKHGHAADHTEVPREKLLEQLDAKSELHSTHRLAPDALYEEITLDLTAGRASRARRAPARAARGVRGRGGAGAHAARA